MTFGRILALGAAGLGLLLTSCQGPDMPLRIVTDRGELALFMEGFAAAHPEVSFTVDYVDNLGDLVRSGLVQADLVVGSGLLNPLGLSALLPLDRFLEEGTLVPGQLLPGLEAPGTWEGNRRAIPLGFDLPLFWGDPGVFPRQGDYFERFAIDIPTLRDTALQGNQVSRGVVERLGFSPLREPDLGLLLLVLEGEGLVSGDRGEPRWSTADLAKARDVWNQWLAAGTVGREAQEAFLATWDYLPEAHLIRNRRISMVYGTLGEFFSLRPEERGGMAFAFPAKNQRVPVLSDLVSVGIPEAGKNQRAALVFLQALLDPANQRDYVRRTIDLSMPIFGFLGLVSSNAELYDQVLNQWYPQLVGLLPPRASLVFPPSQALGLADWESEIFDPFWVAWTAGEAGVEVLERQTDRWLLQQGVEP